MKERGLEQTKTERERERDEKKKRKASQRPIHCGGDDVENVAPIIKVDFHDLGV